jgi:hypothetical protein
MNISEWITANSEWAFGGIGLTAITVIYKIIEKYVTTNNQAQEKTPSTHLPLNITNNINNTNNGISSIPANNNDTITSTPINPSKEIIKKSLPDRKATTKILFIDDDTKFKVVKILLKSGWVNTKIVRDVETIDSPEIQDAHIIFVDVQGVGISMGFNDEGLGLSLALKKKYPQKKIAIYSSETQGDRFHEALRKADSFLPKNADPYEFQQLVEELSETF